MIYICKNKECKNYNKVDDSLTQENYFYRNGILTGEHQQCPVCGSKREDISENNIPLSQKNISFANKYSNASTEEKREILKKRSHEHFNKEVKERKDYLMDKAMTEMRGLKK